MSDIREKVAQMIAQHCVHGGGYDVDVADAAISLIRDEVLEEAAKVVDDMMTPYVQTGSEAYAAGDAQSANDQADLAAALSFAASALRSMKEKKG